MNRVYAIAKYIPAALFGLLLAVWIASLLVNVEFDCVLKGHRTLIGIEDGSLVCRRQLDTLRRSQPVRFRTYSPVNRFFIGRFHYSKMSGWETAIFPAPVLLPILLPIAIGCLIQFRFPLWSWFAWTAFIAAELGYYLR